MMHSLDTSRYTFSFLAVSLRLELATIVAEYFIAAGNWNGAKEKVLASNALQRRGASSTVRMERELRLRLGTLTNDQLQLLATSTSENRAAMAWLAACKYHAFIFDFAAETLRDKLAVKDPVLRPSDYEAFVEGKSLLHPELAGLAATSARKVRQVLLLMLVEAGLLHDGNELGIVQRPILSPNILRVITDDHPRWLAGFLIPDAEIGSH